MVNVAPRCPVPYMAGMAKLTRFNSLDPLAEGQPVFSAGTSRAGEERDSDKRTMGVEVSAPEKNIAAGPIPPGRPTQRDSDLRTMGVRFVPPSWPAGRRGTGLRQKDDGWMNTTALRSRCRRRTILAASPILPAAEIVDPPPSPFHRSSVS